ncbi:hypothetical protein GCK72_000415 [Caenorhabditis remanei]|uniref:Uncharacterized protein n=1 Tax=Caenorhabditis remanei TaxID=31234 RepID=A0A6A5HQS3_CAERE|nr:hypothetical protein GCK72_000415 [Caenorhabditis remanei]KAF1768603.1 hypothetical protein GCK72_000415 [Caenorhabditis remanei]
MRLPIFLLTLAVMATATIYWKHPVKDANQEFEYQLKLIADALYIQDIDLYEKLVDANIIVAQAIIIKYVNSKAEYIHSASKTADGGLIAVAESTTAVDERVKRIYFKWELNAESPSGYKLMVCSFCSLTGC